MKSHHLRSLGALASAAALSIVFAAESMSPPATTNPRVPFPKDYANSFAVIRASNKVREQKLGTIYANPTAAAVKELAQLPYAHGSVIVMEWADPIRDAGGAPVLDEQGLWKKGPVSRIDVMQRGKDFGASYGEKRAGEWEFATYRPDGALMPNVQPVSCAACHSQAAPRDFVFRGRFPEILPK
jgi:hypothetical protein